jgi:hypothetical protein
LEGQGAFIGYGKKWQTTKVSLGKAYGQPIAGGDKVTLRFELGMDCSDGRDGWYIQTAKVSYEETIPGETRKDATVGTRLLLVPVRRQARALRPVRIAVTLQA